MGLDMSGLAARPQLAKQLVAHHLVLALPSDVRQQLVQGKLTAVQTSAGGDYAVLRVAVVKNNMQQQQQLQVTDAQGQTATSVKIIKPDGNKVAVIIDKVLQSGKQNQATRRSLAKDGWGCQSYSGQHLCVVVTAARHTAPAAFALHTL